MSESIYEPVIGLEVHIELKTKTKIFCSCHSEYGAQPNTHCCPVCMGLPGALPVLNREAVRLAIRAGAALGCRISDVSVCDRKNYFYPDLPKGYQISQAEQPLCTGGHIEIGSGKDKKKIRLTRIHIEEDAGKLIHDLSAATLIDLNRAGTPLIEIVSEPDIHCADDAAAFLKKLRLIMLYAGISDCRMNEGSMRCDVNLSVRKKGESTFGVRTEIKNLNSFAYVSRAAEAEFRRQTSILESGGKITRQTLRFDPENGNITIMREKESGADYRFFTEPDIPPFKITSSDIENAKKDLPALPDEKEKLYTEKYQIPLSDALTIISEPAVSEFFDKLLHATPYARHAANLTVSEFPAFCGLLSENNTDFSLDLASRLAELCTLLGEGEISPSVSKKILKIMLSENISPKKYVEEHALRLIKDEEVLKKAVTAAMSENPKIVSDYRSGKKAALKSLMGICMKLTGGSADPAALNRLLTKILDNAE